MSFIYKYTSLENAIKIIENESVILTNPKTFNDPFDSKLVIRKNEIDDAINLIKNYYSFYEKYTDYCKNITKCNIDFEKEIANIKEKMEYTKINTLKKDNFTTLDLEFKKKLNEIILELEDLPRISCFSKRFDSILMWSHYASSHEGVCIEFDENRNIFKNVTYSKNREYFDIKYIVSKCLASIFFNGDVDYNIKDVFKRVMKPFFIKSKDWKYEQEIRCVLSKNASVDGFLYNSKTKMYELKMKINKIFIGAKAKGDNLDYLKKIAKCKNIPIVFMKINDNDFQVIPNYNK